MLLTDAATPRRRAQRWAAIRVHKELNKLHNHKKKRIRNYFIVFFISITILSLLVTKLLREKENSEIARVFNIFEKAYNTQDYSKAYAMMSPLYRKKNTIEEFMHEFSRIEPLERDWAVVRQFNKVHICCNDPGVSFSPNSTMTYVLEKTNGNWFLTGEAIRFLD